jgi:DNA modification methylase
MRRAIIAGVPINLDFSPAGYLYATHPLHAFAARCPPPLADWAITRYSAPGEVVLDPMAGSGTTMVEGCLHGRQAWGVEMDPLAHRIAKAKATPVDPDAFDLAVGQIGSLMLRGGLDDGWRPELPNLGKWFHPRVAAQLAALRQAIHQVQATPEVVNLLWVVFSSLIVARTSVANARDLVHSRHHYRPWADPPDVHMRFLSRLRQIRAMMLDYQKRLTSAEVAHPSVRVELGDARQLPFADGSVDLIFTSPPYCSALDYTRAHVFAVAWMADVLGLSTEQYRALGRGYIGSERAPLLEASTDAPYPPELEEPRIDALVRALYDDRKRAWVVHRYFRDMERVLAESARVVRPGGRIVLVVCPSNIRRVRIPTHELFADLAERLPGPRRLSVEALHERTISDRRRVMPYLEVAFGARMRTEYVLIIRSAEDERKALAAEPAQSSHGHGARPQEETMEDLPNEAFERELHQRLLDGDFVASQELAVAFLPAVVDRIKQRFPRLDDESLVLDATADAILSYAERPSQYDPDKLRLLPYLVMSADGDLKNALRRQQRQAQREFPMHDVELLLDARNVVQEEASSEEHPAVPEVEEVARRIREVIPDPVDQQLVGLMIQGERQTAVFARVLGIAELDVRRQSKIVKRHKDRLKKRLMRLGVRLREPS